MKKLRISILDDQECQSTMRVSMPADFAVCEMICFASSRTTFYRVFNSSSIICTPIQLAVFLNDFPVYLGQQFIHIRMSYSFEPHI